MLKVEMFRSIRMHSHEVPIENANGSFASLISFDVFRKMSFTVSFCRVRSLRITNDFSLNPHLIDHCNISNTSNMCSSIEIQFVDLYHNIQGTISITKSNGT